MNVTEDGLQYVEGVVTILASDSIKQNVFEKGMISNRFRNSCSGVCYNSSAFT
jgi:hypothetical protein